MFKECPGVFTELPVELKNDPQFAWAAIEQNAETYSYLPPTLENNKPFLLEAVKRNRKVLEFASPLFQNDRDVILAANSGASVVDSAGLIDRVWAGVKNTFTQYFGFY